MDVDIFMSNLIEGVAKVLEKMGNKYDCFLHPKTPGENSSLKNETGSNCKVALNIQK